MGTWERAYSVVDPPPPQKKTTLEFPPQGGPPRLEFTIFLEAFKEEAF